MKLLWSPLTEAGLQAGVYWERARECFRLLLSGSLMMPLRLRRSVTGESGEQLRSWASAVRSPSGPPLDMIQPRRACVGGWGCVCVFELCNDMLSVSVLVLFVFM